MAKALAVDSNASFSHRAEMLLSLALLGVLIVLLVPLPPVLLDMLLAANLGVTLVLLLVTLGVKRALDLSVFPSLLLLLTLMRLSLNVATTRLILLDGSAGKIVSAFGNFVVGGNLVVGLVIFLILIIVQFIVITKGAGRVSEVAARFTLDALPGKQMAIDAELNAGSINDKVARARRTELARETEFYGAMDGASKFVRGDAIAGLIVTAINLVGGIILGVTNGLTVIEATRNYSILTIGDGLVSQIPALIIAISAGILVTKSSSEESLGDEIMGQLLDRPAPIFAGAGILGLLALTPGLPKLPFFALAIGAFLYAKQIEPSEPAASDEEEDRSNEETTFSKDEELVDEFVVSDRACVEVGGRLIGLVDSKVSKGLAERIPKLRSDLTQQHGLWIPPIRIRDNLQLRGEEYRLLINGRQVASGELRVHQFLAINPGDVGQQLGGESTVEPTFGLPAMWLPASKKQRAELSGLTVVDPVSVLVTHLGEVLRKYAHELLGREDLQKLIDRLKQTSPTIVEELKPDLLRIGSLHQILVTLLREKVPISDLSRIIECALAHATRVKEPMEIAELLRKDLGRSICDPFRDPAGRVRVIVLSPQLQSEFRKTLHQSELILRQPQLERFLSSLHAEVSKSELHNQRVALLTDDLLRRPIRSALERSMADLAIVAYSEIPTDMLIEQTAMIHREDVFDHEIAMPQTPTGTGESSNVSVLTP